MRAFIFAGNQEEGSFNIQKTMGSIDTGFKNESFACSEFRKSLKNDLVLEISNACGYEVNVVLFDEIMGVINSEAFKTYAANDDNGKESVTNIRLPEAESRLVMRIQDRLNNLWHCY